MKIAVYGVNGEIIALARAAHWLPSSKPSDIAASIDSANNRGENPIKIIRWPFARKIRVDRDKNPAAAKREFHLEIRFPGSVALPRPLELGLVNQLAEFRYEPLHCNHPARRVITPVIRSPCVVSSGSAYGPEPDKVKDEESGDCSYVEH